MHTKAPRKAVANGRSPVTPLLPAYPRCVICRINFLHRRLTIKEKTEKLEDSTWASFNWRVRICAHPLYRSMARICDNRTLHNENKFNPYKIIYDGISVIILRDVCG